MDEPEDAGQILLRQMNAYGNLEATVVDDGRVVYVWVQHVEDEEWRMRPLWLANLTPAADEIDIEEVRRRLAPLMPRDGTRYPEGRPDLDPERLSLVWLEEGNAVALFEGERPSR